MALADVAPGVLLDGRYRIEDVLGQGGMATVYRAHDEVLSRDVAVKLFPATPDADELQRHRSEMHVLASLSHPGLVMLHDAGSAPAGGPLHQTYLVMELVQGPTLADRLLSGPLPPQEAARVGRQLAEALGTVHEAGVVHRDIKPANVLLVDPEDAEAPDGLDRGPIVKIADFGIARFADGARLTMTGTTLGTATYLSPEQAAGSAVGPPADVYALGLVLLECLTGRRAFTGTVVEVAAARLNTSPSVPQQLGPAWVAVLTAMTMREADDRPTMAQVTTALGAILGDTTGEVPTAPQAGEASAGAVLAGQGRSRGAQGRQGRQERRGALAGAAAAVLLAVVLLTAVLLAIRPAPAPAVEYPAVEGRLGAVLEDLARSVEP